MTQSTDPAVLARQGFAATAVDALVQSKPAVVLEMAQFFRANRALGYNNIVQAIYDVTKPAAPAPASHALPQAVAQPTPTGSLVEHAKALASGKIKPAKRKGRK